MEVRDLYRVLWRRKYLIAVLTAAIVAATWYHTSREPRVYQASTLVRVQERVKDPTLSYTALVTGSVLAETYAQIAAADTIAKRIHEELPDVPYGLISGHVTGTPVTDLDLLWLRATSTSPVLATRIADAAPSAIAHFIHDSGTVDDHVIVAQHAVVPSTPISPKETRNLLLAFFGGLVLNGGLVLLLRAIRDPVGASEEIERTAGMRVLATVPTLRFAPPRQGPTAAPSAGDVPRPGGEVREWGRPGSEAMRG